MKCCRLVVLASALVLIGFESCTTPDRTDTRHATSPRIDEPPAPVTAGRSEAAPTRRLRVCSQNLHDFGLPVRGSHRENQNQKVRDLAERITVAKCDLIGVEEVGGDSTAEADRNLKTLAQELTAQSGKEFRSFVADAIIGPIRNGFLVRPDLVQVIDVESDPGKNLPKLSPLAPGQIPPRAPLVLHAKTRQEPQRELLLIAVHMKSKVDSWKDKTHTDFEIIRMESAEAVRRLVEEWENRLPANGVVMVLGDFNSTPDSASLGILTGKLQLADFAENGGCRVDELLRAACSKLPTHAPELTPLFGGARELSGRGSLKFRGHEILIDEMLIRAGQQQLTRRTDNTPAIGIEGVFGVGSDHKLLWTDLNW